MTLELRSLRRGETDHEALWAGVAASMAVMFVAWLRVVEWPPILCPFRVLTGVPCPTCGATRALFAFAQGDLVASLRLNPLVGGGLLLALPYLAYATLVSVFRLPRLRIAQVGPGEARLTRIATWVVLAAAWGFLIVDGR